MSERSYDGYVRVTQEAPRGMIALRGDLSARAIRSALKSAAGTEMPGQTEIATKGARALAWMSRDEALILCPQGEAADVLAKLRRGVEKSHALALDMSDARVMFTLRGAEVREVLAKASPTDTRPHAMPVGAFRRTLVGQVAGAVWLSDAQTAHVICFRSMAEYMWTLLTTLARPGSEVG
ncbi:MAG: sarcosine oxidase subunit gamma [Shimia sp.]